MLSNLETFDKIYNHLINKNLVKVYILKTKGDDNYHIDYKLSEKEVPVDYDKDLQAINALFQFMKYYSRDKVKDFEFKYEPLENIMFCNSIFDTNIEEINKENDKDIIINAVNKLKYLVKTNEELKNKNICIKNQNKKMCKSFNTLLENILEELNV